MLIEDVLEARMGKDEAWRALDVAARDDEHIARVLQHVRDLRREREASQAESRARKPRPPARYDELAALLDQDADRSRFALRRWGWNAGDEDLRLAAEALVAETDPTRKLALLRVFKARAFPLDPAPLITLADSEDWDTVQAALLALENVRQPAVRAYALRAMRDPRKASHAVYMLGLNFEEGDHGLVEWLAEQPEADEDEEHRRGSGITKFVKDHEDLANARILTLIWDKGHCTACRNWLIGDLMEMDALPDAIREECRYDANLELRAMVETGQSAGD